MIKHVITGAAFAAISLSTSAFAQIQDMNPAPGTVFNYEYFELTPADSGSVGNNQTWDFSGAVSTNEPGQRTYRALTTEEQTAYPFANLAYTDELDPTVYLLHASSDSLVDYGGSDILYDNPVVLFKYPITNTYNFTDYSTSNGLPDISYAGNSHVFSQGTGTLITPFGTHEDVIKIRRKTIMYVEYLGQNEEIHADQFSWINPHNKTELLTIENYHYMSGGDDDTYAFFLKEGNFAGIEKLAAGTFSLYPNPSSDVIYVKSASETAVSYKVFSVAGVLIQSGNYSAGQGIATSALQSGEYILQTETPSGAVSHTRFSKI